MDETESGGPSLPTPARAAMNTVAAPPPAGPARDPSAGAHLELDGVRWSVRAMGCSGSSKVPLLLLGFFHPDEPGEPRREALVVGRTLAGLTELQLEAAWRASGEPVQPGSRKPFFPEIEVRSAKDG